MYVRTCANVCDVSIECNGYMHTYVHVIDVWEPSSCIYTCMHTYVCAWEPCEPANICIMYTHVHTYLDNSTFCVVFCM